MDRIWWEEGCYCPDGECGCGTAQDPFLPGEEDSEENEEVLVQSAAVSG